MNYVSLFDLDGVIADWSHRLPLGVGTEEFYAAMPRDPVIPSGATLYNLLATQCRVLGHAIKEQKIEADTPFVDIISCRPEKMRATTIAWLNECGLLMPRALHLRADDDSRPHWQIKLEMYEAHYKDKEGVLCLFEDNAETAESFRSVGVTVYQTIPTPGSSAG